MLTLPIVEHLDVFEDVLLGFIPGDILSLVYQLTLERPEETFDARVVPAVAFTAHARDKTILRESALVAHRGILTTTVRMVDEPRRRSAVHHGHQEGLLRQFTR